MRPITGLGEAPADPTQRLDWCVRAIKQMTQASRELSSLQTVNGDAGEKGAADKTLVVTVDNKGRVTSVQEVDIAIVAAQVTDLGALATLDSVGAAQIDADAVGTSELANNAVETANIADGQVTNAKRADMAEARISGRAVGAGTGAPTDLTGTQAVAILPDASDTQRGPLEHATPAEVYAAATGNLAITAALLDTAAEPVALSFGTPTALDWTSGINFTLTMTGDAVLSNPSNGIPGTWRTIKVEGNSSTDRALTLDTQYVGPNLTDITDADNGKFYVVTIFCVTTTQFLAVCTPSA